MDIHPHLLDLDQEILAGPVKQSSSSRLRQVCRNAQDKVSPPPPEPDFMMSPGRRLADLQEILQLNPDQTAAMRDELKDWYFSDAGSSSARGKQTSMVVPAYERLLQETARNVMAGLSDQPHVAREARRAISSVERLRDKCKASGSALAAPTALCAPCSEGPDDMLAARIGPTQPSSSPLMSNVPVQEMHQCITECSEHGACQVMVVPSDGRQGYKYPSLGVVKEDDEEDICCRPSVPKGDFPIQCAGLVGAGRNSAEDVDRSPMEKGKLSEPSTRKNPVSLDETATDEYSDAFEGETFEASVLCDSG